MNANIQKFTCKECGAHNLTVTHFWNVLAGSTKERWQEWGMLKDNHHWRYDFRQKVEADAEDEVERGDLGDFEEDDSASGPEEYEIHGTEKTWEDDEFFVNCDGCDREIEFGWSKPDRRGQILPIEFSDFIPAESWPDPKYVDAWQHRQWRPIR